MDGCIYRSQFDMCEKSKEEDEKRGIRRWCDFEECEDKHPSNADCIRAMTDKELAEFLEMDRDCYRCILKCIGHDGKPLSRAACMLKVLDWLREEAE